MYKIHQVILVCMVAVLKIMHERVFRVCMQVPCKKHNTMLLLHVGVCGGFV